MLAAVSSGTLTYTIIEAGTAGWGSGITAARWVLSALLATAILFFGLAGATFTLTQIYQFILGYSPLAAGVRSLPSAIALAIAVPAGTRLAARVGIRTAVTTGLLAMTAGLAYLAMATGHTAYPHYLIAATVTAVGPG